MSKVKYRVRKFAPNENQQGSHSFYAETVINSRLTNKDLAAKIEARTGFKSYEVQAVIAAVADIVAEEVLESNSVQLADTNGVAMVSIYPKVSGSISDKDVQDNPEKYNGAQVATEDMLTADMLTWTLGATIGVKFSKKFAIDKQAQKVKVTTADVVAENEEPADNGNQNGGNGTLIDDNDGD